MEPGFYYNMPFEEYAKIEAVNNSFLKILSDDRKCPAHAKEYLDHGRPDTPALRFGRAVDAYILEPTRFMDLYAVYPECDRRTKEGKAVYAKFLENLQPGQEVISQEEYATLNSMYLKTVDSSARRLIRDGASQVVAVWRDPATGILCKGRYDYYQKDIPMITDLKTTSDASPDGFAIDIFKYGYYQQAGFYCMGHEVLTGDDPCFAIFAIEKEEPFVHTAFDIGVSTIEAGKFAARGALRKYKECMESGQWPMFSDKILTVDMPKWALERNGITSFNMVH